MVQREQLHARVDRLGRELGVAESACRTIQSGHVQPGWTAYGMKYHGMMYVRERSADSICDTWLAFFVTKSSYLCSHLGRSDKRLLVLLAAFWPQAGADAMIREQTGATISGWVEAGLVDGCREIVHVRYTPCDFDLI